MKKKILSLLIAVIMLLGQGLSTVCTAASHSQHQNRPTQHRWYKFWHRDKDTPKAKHKNHPSKKHKIKKKDSDNRWFKWHKNKHDIKKKQQNKKSIKKYEKKKKQSVKKHQKIFQKNPKHNPSHNKHNRNHHSKK